MGPIGRATRLAVLIAGLLAEVATAQPAGMTFRDGRLSASIVAAPIRQVIGEIGGVTGVQVEGVATLDDELVSTSFVDLPLANALERVLGARSFALVVGAEGGGSHPSRIVILPGSRGSTARGAEPRPRVVARPEMAVALDEATGMQPERAVRLEALGQLEAIAGEDPDARVVLGQLSADDTDEVVRDGARQALARSEAGAEPAVRHRRARSRVAASPGAW
jgi:hypothetical protein